MLIKATEIVGLPVYTLTDGRKIEDVDDVIYDPKENKVEALLVDKGGWFSDAKIILIENIKGLGKDAVIIDSEKVLIKASDVRKEIALIVKGDTELTGKRIVTENGKNLGKISDIYFDWNTGKVEEFEVTQGTFRDMQSGKKRVRISDIVTIGEDVTIVKEETEEEFSRQANHRGIKGAFIRGQESVIDEVDQLKDRAPSIIDQVKERLKEAGEETKKELGKLGEITKDKAEKLDQKYNVSQQARRARHVTRYKIDDLRKASLERKKERVVGMHLSKTILTPGDKILAKEGDIVTHKLLNMAEQYGVLEQVLNNVETGTERVSSK